MFTQRPEPFHIDATVSVRGLLMLAMLTLCLAACHKAATLPAAGEIEVTVMPVVQKDTPVDFEFTAQTQSSREVEIRARVDGFLDKRLYTEGQMVHAGQTLFQMDAKPFEAALQTAKGQLAQQQARLTVTKANLARVIPLAKQNALSQKDLDDATGNEKQAEAAVFAALGQVQTAQLNLSYTTIKSPLTGLSSFARQQDGSFVTASASGLLTYVYQLDPMWVNFSISENELLRYREEVTAGRLRFPANEDFEVTLIMADGTEFPNHGHISFTNPAFSTETGTFLVRASFANAQGQLRPRPVRAGTRVRCFPSKRDSRAATRCLAGAKSHFVWVVDNDSKAHQRVVEVGEWHGDDWFITEGLKPGERVVVDGAIRVVADTPLKIAAAPAAHAVRPTCQEAGRAVRRHVRPIPPPHSKGSAT